VTRLRLSLGTGELPPLRVKSPALTAGCWLLVAACWYGVTDGTRTRDNLGHNQALYQLSYGHRVCVGLWDGHYRQAVAGINA
jgi:hypothetical protein